MGKEFDLQSLLPRRVFVPPAMPPGPPPMGLPEPPKIDPAQLGAPALPLPVIQAEEQPRLAFESPTGPRAPDPAKPMGAAKLLQPGPSITEMRSGVARGAGAGGLVLADIPPSLSSPGMDTLSQPSGVGSSLELLSDPKGVDFKPYLIQILASVKRNWQSVIPESARLGRRGRVVIQFAISRDGSVPKLVIATPSRHGRPGPGRGGGHQRHQPVPSPAARIQRRQHPLAVRVPVQPAAIMTKRKLLLAMVAYGALAALAAITLEKTPRIVVWLFLAALAVKTWIASRRDGTL